MEAKEKRTLTTEEEIALIDAELAEMQQGCHAVLDDGKFKPFKAKKIDPLKITNAYDLQGMEIKPVQYVVDDILPYGLSIIASPPKTGKSWFVLDLCIAVAEGKKFLGRDTNKCEVLYFALEDSYNRLNERTSKITGGSDYPKGLNFILECSTVSEGLEEQLDQVLTDHPNIKLIVFDTLQYIRSSKKNKNDSAYQADYNEMKAIRNIASKHNLCILLVHHSRKESNPNDPFSNISGTYGINGAMDCMITLNKEARGDKQAKMSICGRDVEYNDFMLEFDSDRGLWKLTGTAEEYQEQKEREEYEHSPVVRTIKKLVDMNKGLWSGKVTDIISSSTYFNIHIHDSAKKIGKDLRVYNELLERYDNIACSVKPNGNATKTYEYRSEIPFKE